MAKKLGGSEVPDVPRGAGSSATPEGDLKCSVRPCGGRAARDQGHLEDAELALGDPRRLAIVRFCWSEKEPLTLRGANRGSALVSCLRGMTEGGGFRDSKP